MPTPAVADAKPFIGSFGFDGSRDFYVALGWKLNWEHDRIAELELGDCRFYLQRYYDKTWCENTRRTRNLCLGSCWCPATLCSGRQLSYSVFGFSTTLG